MNAREMVTTIQETVAARRARIKELAIDPIGKRERIYHLGVFSLLLVLFWAAVISREGEAIHWPWAILITGFVLISDLVSAQGAGDDFWITFTDLPLLAYVAVFGPDPLFILVVFAATTLSHLPLVPLMGGYSGLLFNTSMRTIEVIVAGMAFAALEGVMADPLRVMLLPVIGYLVNLLLMFGTGMAGGFGAQFAIASIREEAIYLSFTVPFLCLIYGTFLWEPWIAIVAATGPVVLTAVSTRSREDLVLTERKLNVDGLTGVANRRRFDDALVEAIEHGEFSMLLFDVDNFKVLNDTHGHMEGDRALIDVAVAVRGVVRQDDLVARYGGEEFAVFLLGLDQVGAMATAERVRAAAELALAEWGTSVSIGVSTWGRSTVPATSSKECIEQTDAALYAAKRTGKNRCVHARNVDDVQAGLADAQAQR
jgi:diguanylate cyclase (GGDEF)-like protein